MTKKENDRRTAGVCIRRVENRGGIRDRGLYNLPLPGGTRSRASASSRALVAFAAVCALVLPVFVGVAKCAGEVDGEWLAANGCRRLVFEKPRRMVAYVARVDLTLPGVRFTGTERDPLWGRPMADYTNETWPVNTKRETTADFMMRRRGAGQNVEIAVNASGWRPWGGREACDSTYAAFYRWVLVDGVEVSHGKKPGRGAYFIVRKNGRAEIRSGIRPSMTNDMAFAVYGNRHLLKDGIPTPDAAETFTEIHPRTAFGLSRDGNTLVILVVDGRQPGYSEGATRADLAGILLREGCSDAVNMDGGGSSSLVVYDRGNDRPIMLNRHANGYVRKTALNLGLIFPMERKTE